MSEGTTMVLVVLIIAVSMVSCTVSSQWRSVSLARIEAEQASRP